MFAIRNMDKRLRIVIGAVVAAAILGGTVLAITGGGGDDPETTEVDARLLQGCVEPEELDDPEESILAADAALKVDAADAGAYFTKGVALYQLQRVEEAAEAFQSATVLDDTCAPYFRALGQTLSDLGQLEPAKAALDSALTLEPEDEGALLARGIVNGRLGELEDALADFDALIELDPDDARGHFNRGLALAGLERLEDAVDAFDEAIGADAEFVDAYLKKAEALEALGRTDEAAEARAKAEELGAEPGETTTTGPVGPVPGPTSTVPVTTAPPSFDIGTLLLTGDQINAAAGNQGAVSTATPEAVPQLCKGSDGTQSDAKAERAGKFAQTVRGYAGADAADQVFEALTAEAKVGCLWQGEGGAGLQLTSMFAVDAPGGRGVGFSLNSLSSGGTSTTRTGALIQVGGRLSLVYLDVDVADGIKPVRALAAAAAAKLAG